MERAERDPRAPPRVSHPPRALELSSSRLAGLRPALHPARAGREAAFALAIPGRGASRHATQGRAASASRPCVRRPPGRQLVEGGGALHGGREASASCRSRSLERRLALVRYVRSAPVEPRPWSIINSQGPPSPRGAPPQRTIVSSGASSGARRAHRSRGPMAAMGPAFGTPRRPPFRMRCSDREARACARQHASHSVLHEASVQHVRRPLEENRPQAAAPLLSDDERAERIHAQRAQ